VSERNARIVEKLKKKYSSEEHISAKEKILDEIQSGKNHDFNRLVDKDRKPIFYDPAIHSLDPTVKVQGVGENHSWEETLEQIDIQVPLGKSRVNKRDIEILTK
jgi:hypothetical protein